MFPERPSSLTKLLVAGLDAADAFELDRRLREAVALEQRLDAEIGSLLIEVAAGHLHRGWGFSSLDTFVRERLGLSPRKARMLLRLQRAARRCPALGAAFRGAQLSWVRAHALVPVVDAGSVQGADDLDVGRRAGAARSRLLGGQRGGGLATGGDGEERHGAGPSGAAMRPHR